MAMLYMPTPFPVADLDVWVKPDSESTRYDQRLEASLQTNSDTTSAHATSPSVYSHASESFKRCGMNKEDNAMTLQSHSGSPSD